MTSTTKAGWFFLAGLIIVLLAVPLVRWGTLSPCEVLRKEMRREFDAYMDTIPMGGELGIIATEMGQALGAQMIDREVQTLTPIECMRGVRKLQREGFRVPNAHNAETPR